ncbi:MAG TPA: class I SAM-dependent methyltransferase [Candidatus Diapherotrites archaeon]|uniref:Class I SAM-dependent methyltransferase n=1 Tax=Candidatus Iainarchaeum sp. TaxID=3101447 RepID=A0A7J4JDT0_9ARCH|nr:class I SAM-dependent methyltransferase [Candidatus Diapherotrites archaeon]HIH15913.1 class I SAM-dependent methyltransferase [Candidatus Diapherotrites archaeon]
MDSIPCRVNQFYERYPYPSLAHFRGRYDPARHSDRILAHLGLTARDFGPGQRILDIGCGTGEISCSLAFHGAQVTALDLCRASLQRARETAERHGIQSISFVRADLHCLPLSTSFDHVFSLGVLHHCPDSGQAFSHVARRVRPGGLLTLGLYSVFGKLVDRLQRQLFFCLGGRDQENRIEAAARFLQGIPPSDLERTYLADKHVHPHETYVSAQTVLGWFKAADIEFVGASSSLNPAQPLLSELTWLGKRKAFYLVSGRKRETQSF